MRDSNEANAGEGNPSVTAEIDPLRRSDVGSAIVRGGSMRAAGYGAGLLVTAATSILLLRHLSVVDFGRYAIVTSLVAIVAGLTEGGLATIASRDLALRPAGSERDGLLANLLGLRLAIAAPSVAVAIAFAYLAGYDHTLVVGTALAAVGMALFAYQGIVALPLTIDLRNGRLAVLEFLKQLFLLSGIAALVAAGAKLLPFFAVSAAVAFAALLVTPIILGRPFVWRPAFQWAEWWTLIRATVPLAITVALNLVYFRVIIILMSLLASAVATGLFATSFRVVEILIGAASVGVSVVMPVLAITANAEPDRLLYMLRRMLEMAILSSSYLIVVVIISAPSVLGLIGGSPYRSAAGVLRIQIFVLIPVFCGQVLQVALIALRRQSAQALATGLALLASLAFGLLLIPLYAATGAAIAALLAEVVLCAALTIILMRDHTRFIPSRRFFLKVLVITALAAAAYLVPDVSKLADALLATAIYALAAWAVRAIPPEVRDMLVLLTRRLRPPVGAR